MSQSHKFKPRKIKKYANDEKKIVLRDFGRMVSTFVKNALQNILICDIISVVLNYLKVHQLLFSAIPSANYDRNVGDSRPRKWRWSWNSWTNREESWPIQNLSNRVTLVAKHHNMLLTEFDNQMIPSRTQFYQPRLHCFNLMTGSTSTLLVKHDLTASFIDLNDDLVLVHYESNDSDGGGSSIVRIPLQNQVYDMKNSQVFRVPNDINCCCIYGSSLIFGEQHTEVLRQYMFLSGEIKDLYDFGTRGGIAGVIPWKELILVTHENPDSPYRVEILIWDPLHSTMISTFHQIPLKDLQKHSDPEITLKVSGTELFALLYSTDALCKGREVSFPTLYMFNECGKRWDELATLRFPFDKHPPEDVHVMMHNLIF